MKMNKLNIGILAVSISMMFSAAVSAQSMSENDFKAGKEKIVAAYKSEKAECGALSGNPKDICVVTAKGKEMVAKADLEEAYKPDRKTHYQARVAKAEAEYAVAKEKCDDMTGNAKDVCRKEAKLKVVAAEADAKVQMKTSDANAVANDKSSTARNKATDQASDARKEATEDKADARFALAKEKCDAYAGDVKDQCLAQAKATFGK
jgi:hypothetical protein